MAETEPVPEGLTPGYLKRIIEQRADLGALATGAVLTGQEFTVRSRVSSGEPAEGVSLNDGPTTG